jgi:hypothetical protein
MKRKRHARLFYPSVIKVDERFNKKTGKMEDVLMRTGPYRKDLCMNDDGKVDVNSYLKHLIHIYNAKKDNKAKMEEHEVL